VFYITFDCYHFNQARTRTLSRPGPGRAEARELGPGPCRPLLWHTSHTSTLVPCLAKRCFIKFGKCWVFFYVMNKGPLLIFCFPLGRHLDVSNNNMLLMYTTALLMRIRNFTVDEKLWVRHSAKAKYFSPDVVQILLNGIHPPAQGVNRSVLNQLFLNCPQFTTRWRRNR
jgi:hypothetical protein